MPDMFMKLDRMIAPKATLNTMAVVWPASIRALQNPRQPIFLRETAKATAPTAPIPPASVGVKTPR